MWIGALLVAATALPVRAQQPSVQIAAAVQATTGDELRLGGQHRLEPDLGIRLFDPGFRFGNLYADLNVTRRDDRVVIGRGMVRFEGWRAAGLTWSVDGGDTWSAPAVQDFGFSNLFAPPVTVQGLSVRGSSARTTVLFTAGRVTAQRNIFGTDVEAIGQQLYQASASHRASERLDVYAHAVHVRSGPMRLYTAFTDRSTDLGGGVRYRPNASLQLVADGGITAFRRRGVTLTEYAPTALAGAIWALPRGWLQINAQRYSLGHYAVSSFPYNDRSGVFVAGEADVSMSAKLFGGAEYARSNLNPDASSGAAVSVPSGTFSRAYGGVRFSLAGSSMLTVRIEGGGREIRPSRFSAGFESDTGVITTEWHGRFQAASLFARYERRSNVDPNDSGVSSTQHEASGQLYVNLRSSRQLFVLGSWSRRADGSGDGETLWHVGGGGQLPVGPLYLRLEGTVGRTHDWSLQTVSNRQSLAVGLGGPVADQTYLSIDCYVDHSPYALGNGVNPWMTRTMIRLTRSLPFGGARSSQSAGRLSHGGPQGVISGIVFADWNGNNTMDADEPPVSGVTVSLGAMAAIETGRDGRFAFAGVPVGEQSVSLDMASVPADYDAPADERQTVVVARNRDVTVRFALFPLGAVDGVVFQDVDNDGTLSGADTPIERAVLVLDDGARTELVRDGRFRFESVRMGSHTISLLVASLPDGAQLAGAPAVTVELSRDHVPERLVFLVKLDKRPEVRKVFPPKKKGI
ncbi:MAG: hypothetical protein NTV05_17920 [Acidobacteria bacterium]|nr:hypothetical protein [Acidobacteriota bacterium]